MQKPKAGAVSAREAAAFWNVSESTILRLIRSGKLKAKRIGRQWRIRISELNKDEQSQP